MLEVVDPSLRDEFLSFFKGCAIFDAAPIEEVWDLRERRITWHDLGMRLDVKVPKQCQGFPYMGGPAVNGKIMQMCVELSVPRHERPRHV